MAVKFTASLDGVGHSELSNWLLSTSFSERYGVALLGHLYFDTGPSNFFGGRGAVSIRDNRGEGFFSRLAPGEVGTITSPPNDSDRAVTDNDGTAPIRFDGNTINARANWAKLLDVGQHLTLTGKATGTTATVFRGDATAVINVTALDLNVGGGVDTIRLTNKFLLTGNTSNIAEQVERITIKINEWGNAVDHVRMGEDGGPWYRIRNMADPVDDQDAVTKKYLNDNASGIAVRPQVRLATAGPLPANTFTVGTNTIEANVVGGPLQIDSTTVALNDRVLIKDETDQIRQGIYDVKDIGGATKWRLVRSLDSDTTPELQPGMYYTVTGGTTNLGSSWVQSSPKPFTLNVDPCLFSLFSSSGGYLGGQGIEIDGKTVHFITKNPYTAGKVPYSTVTGGVSDMAFSNVGTGGQPFLSGGGAAPGFGKLDLDNANNVEFALRVDNGGTGRNNLPRYSVMAGNGEYPSAVFMIAPNTIDYPLCSNGPAAFPSFRQLNLTTGGAFTGILPVENGGTELGTLTQYAVMIGNGVNAVHFASPATANVPLQSNGASVDPTFAPLDLAGAGLMGTLPVGRGGTGRNALGVNKMFYGNGTNPMIETVNACLPGYILTGDISDQPNFLAPSATTDVTFGINGSNQYFFTIGPRKVTAPKMVIADPLCAWGNDTDVAKDMVQISAVSAAVGSVLKKKTAATLLWERVDVSEITGYQVRKFTSTIVAGTTGTFVNHNLNTLNVEVYVTRSVAPFDAIICDVATSTANHVSVTLKGIAADNFNITILG